MRQVFLKALAVLALAVPIGATQASPIFQGRLADGTHSSTCTISGADKCAMFYNTTLDITILNDWNLGKGIWFYWVPASAQAVAETEGAAQTEFTGWVLPQLSQFQSLWNDVGRTTAGLVAQFDGVMHDDGYWSTSELYPYYGWAFNSDGTSALADKEEAHYVVAVRPGDVAAAVSEPATIALVSAALLGIAATRRRKSLAT